MQIKWTKLINDSESYPPIDKLVLICIFAKHQDHLEVLITPHYWTGWGWISWSDQRLPTWMEVIYWTDVLTPPEAT
jgi:hypothetical protein